MTSELDMSIVVKYIKDCTARLDYEKRFDESCRKLFRKILIESLWPDQKDEPLVQ